MSQAFKGSLNINEYKTTHQLKYNFKFWLDHNLAEQGAFFNVNLGTLGWQDDDESRLMPVNDPRYTEPDGSFCTSGAFIWEGRGKEWVWESGLNVGTPIQVSGVYVDDIFVSNSSTGNFAHHIDYSNGRVIFNGPVDTRSTVRAEYSWRQVFVGFSDFDEFRQIIREATVEQFEEFDAAPGSGLAIHSKENRVYLPSIFIEPGEGTTIGGLELGGGQIKGRTVTFHVFASNEHERDLLVDLLEIQNATRIIFFDLNEIPLPLDFDGSLASGAKTWPDLTADHAWKKIRIEDVESRPISPGFTGGIWRAQVTYDLQLDFAGI